MSDLPVKAVEVVGGEVVGVEAVYFRHHVFYADAMDSVEEAVAFLGRRAEGGAGRLG